MGALSRGLCPPAPPASLTSLLGAHPFPKDLTPLFKKLDPPLTDTRRIYIRCEFVIVNISIYIYLCVRVRVRCVWDTGEPYELYELYELYLYVYLDNDSVVFQ